VAAEYEVNIKLNTKNVEQQLKNIDTRTKRTGKMATENINALVKGQDRRARLMNKINELESRGLNVAKLRKQMGKATEELAKRRFGSLQQEFRLLTRTLRLEESKLRILRQQQRGFPSSPLRGTAGMMGSPAQIAASARAGGPRSPIGGAANIAGSPAARRVRRQRLEQVGLGAGFPLLFGGGPGAVLGGAAGGLTGSFGAQIALSAIGQQIDQFVASMVNAGKALTSVGGAADFMAEKSLFSSDAMQFRIEKLIEEGKVTEAAALMTQEMAKQVGGTGLKALKDLGDEANKMGKLFNTLILQVQAFISRALTPLLAAINKVVGSVVLNNQFNALMSEATGARAKEIEEFLKPFTKEVGGQGAARTKSVISAEGKRLAVEKFGGQVIPEGAAIEPTGLEVLRAADAGGGKAAREEERLENRLGKLEEERQKVLEISRFKDQIAAAELLGDTQLVIRLQGQQKLAEIEASRKQALIGVTDQREIEAVNITKATEKLAAHREIERQITEEQHKRQELFDDTVADLEYQLALSQATSEAERERLRIEKKLQELKDDGMSGAQVAQIGDLMRQISAENSPLNKFIKQSVESLNDLETQAVQISQNIGNALGNSIVSGLRNLVTGAESAKKVFADMLMSFADVLAKQAAQMIATYIAIGIARAFAGLAGGSGGKELNLAGVEQYSGIGANTPVTPFAEGGYVSGPTNALVGEAGEPEYVIPESKMRESMSRYSRGARGGSVIPETGGSGTSGEGGGTAVAAPIDVRYTVERINSVDYVTADQFQRGMQQAAAQGATQGEQRALTTLRQNTSQRRRIGL
jgi:hypothetical protein